MSDDIESKVRWQIERLKEYPYAALERQVAERRIAWFKQNYPEDIHRKRLTPRSAGGL
jgi:hypothetical protein